MPEDTPLKPLKDESLETRLLALRLAARIKRNSEESQDKIAKQLGSNQTKISRVKKQLLEAGWIRPTIEVDEAKILECGLSKDDLRGAGFKTSIEDDLHEIYASTGVEFFVMQDPNDSFYDFAGAQLGKLLTDSRLVGVAFGGLLSEVIGRVPRTRTKSRINCIPVSGEPVFTEHAGAALFRSSSLAQRLQKSISLVETALPTLNGVSAYIPSRFNTTDVFDYFKNTPGFRAIFGDTKSKFHISKVDTLLTGIGLSTMSKATSKEPHARSLLGTFIQERIAQEDAQSKKALQKNYVGDIAGVLLPKAETTPSAKEHKHLEDGFVGLQMQHIEKIKQFADASRSGKRPNRPGVIVVTSGNKDAAIHRAIELGLVNKCILPLDLANKLVSRK